MDVFTETTRKLALQAANHQEVLVGFSGGKDSLVITDLLCRCFQRVVAVHLYFVPGLAIVEQNLQAARERWGIDILQYPMPFFLQDLHDGRFCPNQFLNNPPPKVSQNDMLRICGRELGIDLIATGQKKNDSFNVIAATGHQHKKRKKEFFCPIFDWRIQEVLAYLRMHKIPIPDSDGRRSSSMDLTATNLLWLWDKHREDFKRIERYFPWIEAVVWRREWYGIGKD